MNPPRYLDPDPAAAAAGTPPAAAPPTQESPPAAAPPTPDPAPAPDPASASKVVGDITDSTLIEYADKDGKEQFKTLGQLIEASENVAPTVSPERLANLELFEKAVSTNDAAAAKELIEKLSASSPPATLAEPGTVPAQAPVATPPVAPSAESERIARLEAQVAAVTPITNQIYASRRESQITETIKTHAAHLPMLSKLDGGKGAFLVQQRLDYYTERAKAGGVDLSKIDANQQSAITAQAFSDAEREVAAMALSFGVKPEAKPDGTIRAANDQDPPNGASAGARDPRYKVLPGGVMIDTHTNRVVTQSATGQIEDLPIHKPIPAPGGGVPTTEVVGAKTGGPMTSEQSIENMRNKVRGWSGEGGA